jgi:NAD(P)-dependent dehydrogenase (short-subunit alcohol dehydrogenase family)
MINLLITGAENKNSLASEIKNQFEKKYFYRYDDIKVWNITKKEILEDKYEMIIKKLRSHKIDFDIIINCFGINHLSHIGQTPNCDKKILEVNVFVPYNIINTLVSCKNKPAQVLNISSQTYKIAQRTTSLYCASKAALSHMTKVMARELAPKGWQINAIAPGKILDTDMSNKTDSQVLELRGWKKEEADEYAKKLIPMERFTTKNEVAEAIIKILDLPKYINGETISMTGGV